MPDEFYYVILIRFLNGDLEDCHETTRKADRIADLYFRGSDIPRLRNRKAIQQMEKILPLVSTPDSPEVG